MPKRLVMKLRCQTFLWATAALVFACGGGGAPQEAGSKQIRSQVATFAGAKTLEKLPDGAWIVRWTPVEADGIQYSVFKAPQGQPMDYNSPFVSVPTDYFSYRPKNVYTERSICFVVRVTNVVGDTNINSLCTMEEPLSFSGASSLERLADGAYTLKWPALLVEGVIFAVYARQDEDEFNFEQASFDGIRENFFSQLKQVERGTRFCFVVRYQHPDLPTDVNNTELCTEVEAPIEFEGIKNREVLDGRTVKLNWNLADPEIVKSYRVYQGADFKELVTTVTDATGEAKVEGLVPGRQYSFGIRAVDQFGREDRNIVIRSVVMPPE